jgi:CRP-like cAMP-binding protein
MFPLGSAINDYENSYYYEALTKVQVFSAPKIATLMFLQKNPDVIYDLLQRIYRGLEGYFAIMETLLGGSAYHKVVTQLTIYEKRFGKIDLTHTKLASLTGLSRETVTREIAKLQKKNIIKYSGNKLVITDTDRLSKELI